MSDPRELLRLLADPTRLRLAFLLARQELSVAELQELLGMGQSRISSHLSLLRQGNVVTDRKDGKRTYYSLNEVLPGGLSELLHASLRALEGLPEAREDEQHLQRILERRRQQTEAHFNDLAGRLGRNYNPGRSWQAVSYLFLQLIPHVTIADLGAGEGLLSHLLARRARHVYCIDNSKKMVEFGTQLARSQELTNVEYRLGDMEEIPLPNESVDIALFSQALHHAQNPRKALQEAHRILKPGGQVLILDLKEHAFEKAYELYADRWLGFQPNHLYRWLRDCHFGDAKVETIAREEQEPYFETIFARGVRV